MLAYARVKMFWGAIDATYSDESPYTPAQIKPMGENVTPPGIGMRRALLHFDRGGFTPTEDAIVCHLDFVNFTAGNPDDTWTDADFASLEARIVTWWNAVKPYVASPITLTGLRWYRIGPGTVPPNPAVRIQALGSGASGTTKCPPQVATSITFKTAVRRTWGRTYLPTPPQSMIGSDGRITSAAVAAIGAATNSLASGAAGDDFMLSVFSKRRGKAYTVEKIQVDDLFDVIRSRRYHSKVNQYLSP